MTKKKRYIAITSCVLVILTILLLTGGIYIYIGPTYRYDRKFSVIEEGDGFIPKQFHLEYNATELPLIPLLLTTVISKLPKNINISKYDITYLKTHKGFTSFKIDELTITYDNGEVVNLITNQRPEEARRFQITENWTDSIILHSAIREKSSFQYHLEGESFSEDGSSYPFEYEVRYEYSYNFRVGTRFARWASI